jgi:hypothetical protein
VPLTLFLADPEGYLPRRQHGVIVEAGDDVETSFLSGPSGPGRRRFSELRRRPWLFRGARLREQIGYKGDIRALGKYILDQVPLARRCGVSSFEISKPEVLKALKAGEWPEVTKYLQPVGTVEEIPEGTRPWARRSHRDVAIAAE